LVIGCIDYCNSILHGLLSIYITKLQCLQNSAARLIFKIYLYCRFSHITPVLYSLHWLPVKFSVELKIMIITFKAIYGLAPSYICELINIKESGGYNLRSNKGLLLQEPRVLAVTECTHMRLGECALWLQHQNCRTAWTLIFVKRKILILIKYYLKHIF